MSSPDRDIHDQAAGSLREQAVENIAERIKSGKGRITVHDLLDAELNSDRCRIVTEDMAKLLTAEHHEHGAVADSIVDGLIERYISTHGDLVEEEAEEIEAHAGEDA